MYIVNYRARWACRCRGITFIGISFSHAMDQALDYIKSLETRTC